MALHGSIVLLVLTALWAASQVSAANGSVADCCLTVKDKRIPKNSVKDYYMQEDNTGCHIKALVLVTVKDRRICVPHNARWAKKIKEQIDNTRRKKRHIGCQSEDQFN